MARARRREVRHVVVLSDTHFGSAVGLCPPEFALDDGGLYRFSEFQDVLWLWWQEFWSWVPQATRGEPYALVHNGDVIEGTPKGSVQVFSSNLADQERCAVAVLGPVVKQAERFFLVRGTEAHGQKSAQAEERIAASLGAEGHGSLHSRWEVSIRLARGGVLHATHHIGVTSSTAYETSALSRELASGFVEAGQWQEEIPDLMVRSHRHRFSLVAIPTARGVAQLCVTPGWQLKTAYVYRLGHSVRLPQIGGIVVSAEAGGLVVKPWVRAPRRAPAVNL